jgi:hypothetical protein
VGLGNVFVVVVTWVMSTLHQQTMCGRRGRRVRVASGWIVSCRRTGRGSERGRRRGSRAGAWSSSGRDSDSDRGRGRGRPGASDVAARRVCGGGQSVEEQRGPARSRRRGQQQKRVERAHVRRREGWRRAGYAGRVNCAKGAGAVSTTALGRIGRACRRCYGQDAGAAAVGL